MVFCSAENIDKLLLRQDASEKLLLSMEAKLHLLQINLEINAGNENETTLPVTRKEQQHGSSVLTLSGLTQNAQNNTIQLPRRRTGTTLTLWWTLVSSKKTFLNTCSDREDAIKTSTTTLEFPLITDLQLSAPWVTTEPLQSAKVTLRNPATTKPQKTVRKLLAKVWIIHYGSVNGIDNLCSYNTNVVSCSQDTMIEIDEKILMIITQHPKPKKHVLHTGSTDTRQRGLEILK